MITFRSLHLSTKCQLVKKNCRNLTNKYFLVLQPNTLMDPGSRDFLDGQKTTPRTKFGPWFLWLKCAEFHKRFLVPGKGSWVRNGSSATMLLLYYNKKTDYSRCSSRTNCGLFFKLKTEIRESKYCIFYALTINLKIIL